MLDIKDLIIETLKVDAAIAAITGATEDDPRVYSYYQPGAVINDQKQVYITYAMTQFPEQTRAIGEPTFSLALWGKGLDSVHAVRDRVVELFDDDVRRNNGILTALLTPAGRYVRFNRVGERDSYQENTKFTGITLQFRVGFSKV